jgi:hypothetical protein
MKNAAGDKSCDDYIREELNIAGVPFEEFDLFKKSNGEVPSSIIGLLDGWEFRRAWYYWVVSSTKNTLLFKYADPLHESFGKDVRVDGHCGCPSPREWCKAPWQMGVNFYHVDSQEGLNALVNAIKEQTRDN